MSNLDQAWTDYKLRANKVSLLDAAKKSGATLKKAGGGEYVGPCPGCGGTDRFAVNTSKNKWVCRGAGGGGDAIGLVMHCAGLTFPQACQELTGEAPPSGGTEYTPEQRAAWAKRQAEAEERDQKRQDDEAQDELARLKVAKQLWGEAQLIEGSVAEDYLRSRVKGLEGKLPDVLRFHPKCFLGPGQYHPALVALVQGAEGNQLGAWRIYLDAQGNNLRDAEGNKIKKGLGPCGGGAVRLHPPKDGRFIAVCEGIETAFGVHLLSGLPVWACRTANGLSGLELPREIERLAIYPDGDKWKWQADKGRWLDPTGRREALKLAELAVAQGIEVLMQPEPMPGFDFLEVHNSLYMRTEIN
ncbi:hypothetical protein HCG46_26190 [Labrenzia sp. PO1]|uniref:DUF7146 domain-containing protein n=1 Tax=Labrenzia sp. PO1 TaxID=2720390 RepID=UPI0014474A53|nr:toprim domain-containing protein [Labrenzia sp. PO1]NKI61792.1 hypothetical protein [Labrenzia sp. PO1]